LSKEFFLEYELGGESIFKIGRLDDTEIVGYFSRFVGRRDSAGFVAVRDGEVVGYITVRIETQPSHWTVKRVGRISGLMVAKQSRRGGLGSRLLDAAESYFAAAGVRHFTVYTAIGNSAGLGFYRAHGLRPLHTNLLGEVDGPIHDSVGGTETTMQERAVTVFFYGSYINRDVLKEVGLNPERLEIARLPGFDIQIRPLANLVRSDCHTVYGILVSATHAELERLYSHARDVLGGVYLPEAVVAHAADGRLIPALCYIATAMEPRPASSDYINRIVGPARSYGFPDWYVSKLESFRGAA
jgi:ribosomal protein S18 acetylase RimI-like enzyme